MIPNIDKHNLCSSLLKYLIIERLLSNQRGVDGFFAFNISTLQPGKTARSTVCCHLQHFVFQLY